MFTKQDIIQLNNKGITIEAAQLQMERFKAGFAQLDVMRPATANDGIKVLTNDETAKYAAVLDNSITDGTKVSKFVPASGAATRMFKDLYQYIENPTVLRNLPSDHPIVRFTELLTHFAFFPIIYENLKLYNLENVHVRKSKVNEIINLVLNPEGLNYGKLPKGLIHFHRYGDIIRTAMEEHLVEGSQYAANANAMVNVHFTVSPEHENWFKTKLYQEGPSIENQYEIGLDVSFSFQKPHTDTLAATPNNEPFRNDAGLLVFRPGGHGALIENLNELVADVIFIKNIDNVVPEHLLPTTVQYKKALGGILVNLSNAVHSYLKQLDKSVNETIIEEIVGFIKNELFASTPKAFKNLSLSEKGEYLKKYLNRPIRVCGMVKNEGEPGGGPFWVMEKSGQETLQILESSQFNLKDSHQEAQLKAATHFNPVDLVCCPMDYKGNKFDLTKFADPETGFISEKSLSGKNLQALELPGLWNGAMANWITLFAEVPIETFNPVKTVNDLLRPQHQPGK
jgi:hypothetical protein